VARQSSIEWTETTWNPVVGCTKVSTGCANCYAERMAKRLAAISKSIVKKGNNPGRTAHYEKVVNQRGHWTGEVSLNEDALNDPISWVSPRTIFVNSMSDLFHSKVPFAFIHRVFQVMKRCPQHTFQVLTKRPERAADLAAIPGLVKWGLMKISLDIFLHLLHDDLPWQARNFANHVRQRNRRSGTTSMPMLCLI